MVTIHNELNYTERAEEIYINYELAMYGNNSSRLYEAINSRALSHNDVLWYQAFEGFTFLSQPSINLAAELRRFIFKNVLKGQSISQENKTIFRLPNGENFNSLTAPQLIEKMTEAIHKHDKNISKTLIVNYLLSGNITRDKLIQIIFSLGADKATFDKILSSGAFFRKLSPAVPNELIILYCLENKPHDRKKTFELLQTKANELMANFTQTHEPNGYLLTPSSNDINLNGISQEEFKNEFLTQCCRASVHKLDSENKQFSATAKNLMLKSSVLQFLELEGKYHTLFFANPKETVFITDIVCAYIKNFLPLDHEDYGLVNIIEDNVMSQNLYCRFLNYRIMAPNSRKIYSMEYGSLPQQIKDNVLTYPELVNIPAKAHRINRHDLLISFFYYFIMRHWKNNIKSLTASSQSEANMLWKKFFKDINTLLRHAGYEDISFKNPLDALVRISMHALNPIECYTRIYELNVLSSYSHENEKNENYPTPERIQKVIASLKESYSKMAESKLISHDSTRKAYTFCEHVSKKLHGINSI